MSNVSTQLSHGPNSAKRPEQPPSALGKRLREERELRGLSVRELARRLGVSASLISQIETGRSLPSVVTLQALTAALDVSIDSLFAPARSERAGIGRQRSRRPDVVVRRGDRKAIDLEGGVHWERLTADDHPEGDFLLITYGVGGSSGATLTQHGGREFGLVLSGTLNVTLQFEDYILNEGDSIAFPSTTPHRLWNGGEVPAVSVWFVFDRR